MRKIWFSLLVVTCLTGASCEENRQNIPENLAEVDKSQLKKICIDIKLPGEDGEKIYRSHESAGYSYVYQKYYETDTTNGGPSWCIVFTLLNGHEYQVMNEHVLYIQK